MTDTTDMRLEAIVARFAGVDIQCRHRGSWEGEHRWRARIITNKNERDDYRLTIHGDSAEDVVRRLYEAMLEQDRKGRS